MSIWRLSSPVAWARASIRASSLCSDGRVNTPDIRTVAALRDEGWTTQQLQAAVADGTFERVRRGRYTVPAERDATGEHILRTVAAWEARSPDHVDN